MLKAKTMYNMVDDLELGGLAVKLLFLKNQQALTIAKDPALIDLMIEKLVTKPPNLVINMLNSQGFQAWIDAIVWVQRKKGHAGVGDKAPFLSMDDESRAMRLLDDFMATILIPLAAKTSALVICCATPCNCILSTSFTRMWRQQVETLSMRDSYYTHIIYTSRGSRYPPALSALCAARQVWHRGTVHVA